MTMSKSLPLSRTSDLSAVASNDGARSILPGNFNFSVEIISGDYTIRPDGTVHGSFITNPDKTECQVCRMVFRNLEKVNEHQERFRWPCKNCYGDLIWCQSGWAEYQAIPYCTFACVEHGKCFDTGKAAQDHEVTWRGMTMIHGTFTIISRIITLKDVSEILVLEIDPCLLSMSNLKPYARGIPLPSRLYNIPKISMLYISRFVGRFHQK
ncbi:hypothetical protein BKA66DRAFT_584104 [Pyrenochaeta sp. MPI-SDFR-AT-0127]|nr:hypothetical protein BKA66DRAFT_584104 [Pyrenochaeta sp. MPI-SDFR-AT-0127]